MFCLRKGLDFYRSTWREYVLMARAHDEDRLDRFEEFRMLAYCSVLPYLKDSNTSIESFWPIPERDNRSEDKDGKISDAKKFMDEVTAKYKEYYNR